MACTQGCEGGYCYLKDFLEHQSGQGGAENKDLSGQNGKYWKRQVWEKTVANTNKSARESKCNFTTEVLDLGKKLTQDKIASRELV